MFQIQVASVSKCPSAWKSWWSIGCLQHQWQSWLLQLIPTNPVALMSMSMTLSDIGAELWLFLQPLSVSSACVSHFCYVNLRLWQHCQTWFGSCIDCGERPMAGMLAAKPLYDSKSSLQDVHKAPGSVLAFERFKKSMTLTTPVALPGASSSTSHQP